MVAYISYSHTFDKVKPKPTHQIFRSVDHCNINAAFASPLTSMITEKNFSFNSNNVGWSASGSNLNVARVSHGYNY